MRAGVRHAPKRRSGVLRGNQVQDFFKKMLKKPGMHFKSGEWEKRTVREKAFVIALFRVNYPRLKAWHLSRQWD